MVGEPHENVDLARRLKLGMKADLHASGAVRLPGTRNYKLAYAPHFPTVEIAYARPHREVSHVDLEPFLASKEIPPTWVARISAQMPDYPAELAGAPKKRNGEPDRSQADWNYDIRALAAGMTGQQVAAVILKNRTKAMERKGRSATEYAERTAHSAARSIQLR